MNVIVGAYWYSPVGFGKLWVKLTGVNHMKMPEKEANRAIVFVALSAVLQALALAIILHSLGVSAVEHGLLIGVVLWLGFTGATTVGTTLYQRFSWKYWWLNASYFLLVMSINSVILTVWQ